MSRSVRIAGLVVLIAVVAAGGTMLFAEPSTEEVGPETADEPELVVPGGSDSGFWAYLNARPAFEQRSPVNVIVRGNTDEVIQIMTEETDAEWDELDEEDHDAESETFSADAINKTAFEEDTSTTADWFEATGSTRYAYVDPGAGDGGQWVKETMQLEDGDYYGTRYHIRLYESPNPDDEWVILQTHTEHLRLVHAQTSC